MNQIRRRIVHIFSSGVDASRLDTFRIVMPLVVMFLFRRIPWEMHASVPDCIWSPPGLARWFLPSSLTLDQIVFLRTTFLLSMVTLSAGFLARISSLASAICLFLLVGNSIGAQYADRSANPLILVFIILTLSPSLGTKFSVDSLLFKPRPCVDADSIWPTRLIQFVFFFTFFSAGYSKIIHSGLAWVESENIVAKWIWAGEAFRSQVLFEFQPRVHDFVIRQKFVAGILGSGVVLLEIFSLLFFTSRRWIEFGVLSFALMQAGIFLVMYISFDLFLPLYLIFLPIEKLVRIFEQRKAEVRA